MTVIYSLSFSEYDLFILRHPSSSSSATVLWGFFLILLLFPNIVCENVSILSCVCTCLCMCVCVLSLPNITITGWFYLFPRINFCPILKLCFALKFHLLVTSPTHKHPVKDNCFSLPVFLRFSLDIVSALVFLYSDLRWSLFSSIPFSEAFLLRLQDYILGYAINQLSFINSIWHPLQFYCDSLCDFLASHLILWTTWTITAGSHLVSVTPCTVMRVLLSAHGGVEKSMVWGQTNLVKILTFY